MTLDCIHPGPLGRAAAPMPHVVRLVGQLDTVLQGPFSPPATHDLSHPFMLYSPIDPSPAGHVDRDGWFYALDWPLLRYPPTPDQSRRKVTDLVRRRRWIRRRRWVGLAAGRGSGGDDGALRRLLGAVAPGERLPLPMGWEAEGCELQVGGGTDAGSSTRLAPVARVAPVSRPQGHPEACRGPASRTNSRILVPCIEVRRVLRPGVVGGCEECAVRLPQPPYPDTCR